MTATTNTDQPATLGEGIFIVRQGEGESASYAICYRVDSVPGTHTIPGNGQTVKQLVDQQRLEAAYVAADKMETGGEVSFRAQSGENISVSFTPR